MTLNVVTLVGHVGQDPDVKYFEPDKVKCRLTLAVNRWTRDGKQTDWFNLELWGREAQVATNYVRKGSLIGIKGSLKFDTWSDRATGVNRSSPIIKVDRLDLLGSKRDGDANQMDNYNRPDEF